MTNPMFNLQAHVDLLYTDKPRRLAFRAQTLSEFTQWQQALRGEIVRLLGLAGRRPVVVRAEHLQHIDRDSYTEEKFALDVGEGVMTPIYLLVPKTPPPYKPVLVFHGHSPSVQYVLGNFPDAEVAQDRLAHDGNYAQALAQAGYLVCAVEQRGFGERQSRELTDNRSCRHLAFEYLMQGRTLIGERCWDGICAINYLHTRDDVVPGVLGCTGNSGGGTTALWLSVIDDRVTVSVPSCYFCSFKESILNQRHCECNYLPGVLAFAEMGDVAALIAPRPLRFIAGEQDGIFPVSGVREQYETVRRAYALHQAASVCSLTVHPGGHAYHHGFSHDWFGKHL